MAYLVGWAFCGLIGFMIGNRKDLGTSGFFLGLLLGPIGWIITGMSTGSQKECPNCKTLLRKDAIVCKSCGRSLVPESQNQNIASVAVIADADPESIRKCPFCAEDIKKEAIYCKHCKKDLPKE